MTALLGLWGSLSLSALAAGVINAVAGGGTLLTFPTLLTVVTPVVANATSTVALVPGSLAGAWGYRREFRNLSRNMALLAAPSFVGGVTGALLVTRLPARYFAMLVPWLILTATVLLLLQPLIRQWSTGLHHASLSGRSWLGVIFFQFLIAVYGGYFGAGIGILMLSALGLMGLSNIHEMNALKTALGAIINGVSVVVFMWEGKVNYPFAGVMALAAMVGGYLGAHGAQRLNPAIVRWFAILIGFGLALYYFTRR
jgi:uncharacterized membrane protein YfcA